MIQKLFTIPRLISQLLASLQHLRNGSSLTTRWPLTFAYYKGARAFDESFNNYLRYPAHTSAYNTTLDQFRGSKCRINSSSWLSLCQRHATYSVAGVKIANPWRNYGFWSSEMPWQPFTTTSTQYYASNIPSLAYNCYNRCRIRWAGVKVAYWPEPGRDTACLSKLDSNSSRDPLAQAMLDMNNNHADVSQNGTGEFWRRGDFDFSSLSDKTEPISFNGTLTRDGNT